MEKEPKQIAYEELRQLAERRGYITYDDIMDCSDNFSLSLQDFDWLTGSLITIGTIIYTEAPVAAEKIEDNIDDYAQIDYETVYAKIKAMSPSLAPFVDAVKKIRPPQWNEIKQLKYQVAEGNQHARNRMIEMNLRLALRIALQRAETYDLEIEDTVSLACIGLITAVDKYDPDSQDPFASYAGIWVWQSISREQENQRPLIYYPAHAKEGYIAVYPFLKQYGCIGCDEILTCKKIRDKIMERLECDEGSAMFIIEETMAVEHIWDFLEFSKNSNPDSEYIDLASCLFNEWLPDTIVTDTVMFENLYRNNMRETIDKLLETLTSRERKIICGRYGLSDGAAKTLDEIGKAMNITRERVRQIEGKALKKLQHPTRQKAVEGFLE